MKSIILYYSFTLFSVNALAQLSGIGVGAGGSASTFEYGNQVSSIKDFGNEEKIGGTGGIKFDFDLGNENTKFSPEVFIIQNGAKEYYQDFNQVQGDLINRRVSLDYFGLYLPFKLYLPIDNGLGNTDYVYNGIVAEISGFLDYALNGTIIGEDKMEEKVAFASNSNKLDMGFSFSGGFVFNGVFMKFGYQKGIKNIEFNNALGDVDDQNYLINNKGFTLTVGFLQKLDN